jgi:hypothetical protein
LHKDAFDLPCSLDTGVIESQFGISVDMATAPPVISASIGHCPVAPLAASPLRGSIAHSSKTRSVRRIFIATSIAQQIPLWLVYVDVAYNRLELFRLNEYGVEWTAAIDWLAAAFSCRTKVGSWPASVRSLAGVGLDFSLLSHFQCVVDLDAEVSNRALQFGVAKKQLHRPQVFGAPVDQRCIRARIVCVPYAASSRPIDTIQRCTARAYCRVDICGDPWIRLGKRKSEDASLAALIQDSTLSRVCSVISNWAGRCVFCWMTMALGATCW